MKENCPLYNTNAELGILFYLKFKSKKKCCKKYKKKGKPCKKCPLNHA